jgi:hypothetical protein
LDTSVFSIIATSLCNCWKVNSISHKTRKCVYDLLLYKIHVHISNILPYIAVKYDVKKTFSYGWRFVRFPYTNIAWTKVIHCLNLVSIVLCSSNSVNKIEICYYHNTTYLYVLYFLPILLVFHPVGISSWKFCRGYKMFMFNNVKLWLFLWLKKKLETLHLKYRIQLSICVICLRFIPAVLLLHVSGNLWRKYKVRAVHSDLWNPFEKFQ